MIVIEYLDKPVSVNKRYYKNFSLTSEYRFFKETLGWEAKRSMQSKTILNGPLWCDIDIQYKGRNPDIDNYLKPILDAMEGIVYHNDNQITRLIVDKTKSKEDRVKISIDKL